MIYKIFIRLFSVVVGIIVPLFATSPEEEYVEFGNGTRLTVTEMSGVTINDLKKEYLIQNYPDIFASMTPYDRLENFDDIIFIASADDHRVGFRLSDTNPKDAQIFLQSPEKQIVIQGKLLGKILAQKDMAEESSLSEAERQLLLHRRLREAYAARERLQRLRFEQSELEAKLRSVSRSVADAVVEEARYSGLALDYGGTVVRIGHRK
jgi:hypothetical protein